METATVIIPCYNAQATIERAVYSALNQTLPVKVIVVDDCSTDQSFPLLEKLTAAEPRLTAVRLARNCGPSSARNAALRRVATPWVAGLDSDDYMLPRRMERLVAHGEASGMDFVADDLIRIQQNESPAQGHRVWREEPFGVAEFDTAGFVRQNLRKYAGFRREIGYLKPIMRTSFLKRTGLLYNDSLRLAEDYELYVRSFIAGARWQVIDVCGYIAVDRPGSLSNEVDARALEALLGADNELIELAGKNVEARKAIAEHRHHTATDLAWMKLIEAVRARQVGNALKTFGYSPSVSAKLATRVVKHILRIPLFPDYSQEVRTPIGEAAIAQLT